MDSLELAKEMLTSINACGGLYIEEIITKFNSKCDLTLILETISAGLRRKHIIAVDCLSGTKCVLSNGGKEFLNSVCLDKMIDSKKRLFALNGKNKGK